ncbi:MAG: HEPN domain-containing protein [Nitrospirae bacterium]|nr:HEPN domain-containing protein [Nitrospirota bacterium]
MQKDKHITEVIREWINKAENDLINAANTLKMGDDCPTDTVCFHAQQCAEKYVKALLVWKGIPFPKTHNLSLLMALLPLKTPALLSVAEQKLLTDYAVVTRYPGDEEEPTLGEARKAVSLARRVRKNIRGMLPKEALTPIRRKKTKGQS